MAHRAPSSSLMPADNTAQAFAAAASSDSAAVPPVPLQVDQAAATTAAAAAAAAPRSSLVYRDSFGRPLPPSLAEGLGYSLPRNPALGPFHPDPPPLNRSEPLPIPGRAAATAAASSLANGAGHPQFASPSDRGALIPYDGVGSPAGSGAPRRYTRDAIQAVSDRASALLNANTAPSRVVAFGVHTSLAVANAFTPTFAKTIAINQWSHYGEPLLNKVDQRLDEAFQMVEANRGGAGGAAGPQGQAAAAGSGAAAAAASSPSEMSDESPAAANGAQAAQAAGAGGDAQRAQALALHQQEQAMLVASRWYARVDSILLQNRVFAALSQVTRPAEAFYSCITEEFVSHDDVGEFMTALKTRVGPAWDDRLTPLALGFYQTAKAVRLRVFGAGRFVGGVVQHGKDSVHHSIEQLMQRWEQVLGTGDAYVDRWLPERETQAALMPEDSRDAVAAAMALVALEGAGAIAAVKMEDAVSTTAAASSHNSPAAPSFANVGSSSSSSSRRGSYAAAAAAGAGAGASGASTPSPRMPRKRAISALDEPDASTEQTDDDLTAGAAAASSGRFDALPASSMALALSSSHGNGVSPASGHTVSDLTGKVTKRLRQRIPTLQSLTPTLVLNWSDSVRSHLTAHRWFAEVDEILLQNHFVSALAHVMQPAQHFYDTAMRIFQTTVIRQKNAATTTDEQTPQKLITSGSGSDGAAAAASNGSMLDTEPSSSATPNSSTPTSASSPAAAAAAAAAFVASTSAAPVAAASASPVANEFVVSLRSALGASWDDRLRVPALSFLQTAWRAAITQRMQQRAQSAAASPAQP